MILDALLLSLQVAAMAGLFGLPIAWGLAWVLARKSFPGKRLLDLVIHAPLVLPPVAVGYLLLLAFSPRGWIGGPLQDLAGASLMFTTTGAVLASLIMALPLMVRAMRQALESGDRRLEQAAASLGATPWRVHCTVTVPLAAPGLTTAAILGFARAFGEFGATIGFVGSIPGVTETLPLALYKALQVPGREADAHAILLIALGVAFAALVLSEWLSRRMARRLAP